MFSPRTPLCIVSAVKLLPFSLMIVCHCLNAIGMQLAGQPDPSMAASNPGAPAPPTNGTPLNAADGFGGNAPVMTFVDLNGQPYGRYVVNETVPIVAYNYQDVTEKIYVPKNVTEQKMVTQTQYTPVYSYQPQLKNVTSWNPFAQPQQVWEYVPIVQYQPNYVQVPQTITYQKYELQDVVRRVPFLETRSEQKAKFVDRPIAALPQGGYAIASVPIGSQQLSNAYNGNVYQQAAIAAQANRNLARIPSVPINTPGRYGPFNNSYFANAPAPYYVAQNAPNVPMNQPNNPVMSNQPNYSFASVNPAAYNTSSNTTVFPAVPLRPNLQAPNYPNQYLANNYQQPAYTNTAARPSIFNRTGTLFGNSIFSNNRNNAQPATTFVASNTPVSQPYLWGPQGQSTYGFRPNSSPYVAPSNVGMNQPSWGMTTSSSYRDPLQGGMQATELR